MRCDLHVHSLHSGAADLPVLRHLGRECYSEPEAVYEGARRRGMDLVTLTDHDSIEGALRLAHHPDTFVSEEVTLHLEGGRLPLIEALNGSQPAGHNAGAYRMGREAGMSPVGGSDSHTLTGVARAWTRVPGARTRREFLEGLRQGLTVVGGRSGTYARLTGEVTRIFAAGYHDAVRAAFPRPARTASLVALLPFLPLLPVFTAFVHLHELVFGARLLRELDAATRRPGGRPGRARPLVGSLGEAA